MTRSVVGVTARKRALLGYARLQPKIPGEERVSQFVVAQRLTLARTTRTHDGQRSQGEHRDDRDRDDLPLVAAMPPLGTAVALLLSKQ